MQDASTIEIEVIFFARARDLAGGSSATMTLPSGTTVAAAAADIEKKFPGLGAILGSCRFALNEEFAAGSDLVPDRSVLAVIPPVSGG